MEQTEQKDRDGFIIYRSAGSDMEEIHFVPCERDGYMREQVLRGVVRRTTWNDNQFVVDTREIEGDE